MKQFLKVILSCVFVFPTLAGTAFSSPNEITLTSAIATLGPSVVRVGCEYNGKYSEPHDAPSGSGFLAADGSYVITAAHVITALERCSAAITDHGQAYSQSQRKFVVATVRPGEEIKSGPGKFRYSAGTNFFAFALVEKDEGHDVALLKLEKNPVTSKATGSLLAPTATTTVPNLCTRRPQEGESIVVSGYPFASPIMLTTSGAIASSWGVDSKDVQVQGAVEHLVEDIYLADVRVNGGNSGGPVFSRMSGAVIGIVTAFDPASVQYGDGDKEPATVSGRPIIYNSGLALVVPIQYATQIMQKHQISWKEACE